MSDETALLSQVLDQLKEITEIERVQVRLLAQDRIERNLSTQEERAVYDLSDGHRSAREIQSLLDKAGTKISHTTVTNYWKKWADAGLVRTSPKWKGRYQKIL